MRQKSNGLAGCIATWGLFALAAGCMDHGTMMLPQVMDVSPYQGSWDLLKFSDKNADPNIVEVDLEAKVGQAEFLPGKVTPVWTYNGGTPGPTLEAKVGDKVIVHFKNSLPEPTTIHWHGVRVPNDMDGVALMQQPIAAGGSFDYTFTAQDAGTFWYHPHHRSDVQVEKGLYGAIVVRGPMEPTLSAERVAILDDVYLDSDGMPMPQGSADELMIGRQGNLLLVNGKPRPITTLRAGERHRFRFINAANARYFRLALPGHKLTLLGVDGGLLEVPRQIDELMLVPGERADVVVTATGSPGEELDIMTMPYERGHGSGMLPAAKVMQVRYTGEVATTTPMLPSNFRSIDALPVPVRSRMFVLAENQPASGGGHGGGHGGAAGGSPSFTINGQAFPNITPLVAKLGETELWEVISDEEIDHPFHIHGFFFQVLSRGGIPEPFRAWKDTVNIKGKQTLQLAVRFDGFDGKWLFHCHILEHSENGMTGELDITK